MAVFKVVFVNERAKNEFLSLPTGIRARSVTLLKRMEMVGPNLGMPHTRFLDHGIFEVRAKSSEGIGRTLYCTRVHETIYVLHAFVKKAQKLPRNDLNIARERMKEIPI